MRSQDVSFGPAVFGEHYDHTFGSIIDYDALAAFLGDAVPPEYAFADLACGTGSLLAAIRRRQLARPIAGIDLSADQLRLLHQRLPDAICVQADVVGSTDAVLPIARAPWFVHAGFSFCNLLPEKERLTFLRRWAARPHVTELAVEIWDQAYQLEQYAPDIWHRHELPNGVLRARNRDAGSNAIDIEFVFELDDGKTEAVVRMYRFSVSEFIAMMKRAGWAAHRDRPCTYRPIPRSHRFLIMSRA